MPPMPPSDSASLLQALAGQAASHVAWHFVLAFPPVAVILWFAAVGLFRLLLFPFFPKAPAPKAVGRAAPSVPGEPSDVRGPIRGLGRIASAFASCRGAASKGASTLLKALGGGIERGGRTDSNPSGAGRNGAEGLDLGRGRKE